LALSVDRDVTMTSNRLARDEADTEVSNVLLHSISPPAWSKKSCVSYNVAFILQDGVLISALEVEAQMKTTSTALGNSFLQASLGPKINKDVDEPYKK